MYEMLPLFVSEPSCRQLMIRFEFTVTGPFVGAAAMITTPPGIPTSESVSLAVTSNAIVPLSIVRLCNPLPEN